MKRIIDISEEEYKFIKDLQFYSSGRRNGKTIEKHVINAIKNSAPYNPSGELISREALKKEVEGLVVGGAEGLKDYYENGSKADENSWIGGVYDTWELINSATPVELTEEQAIDKLHETGWLPRHDKEMTERQQGECKSCRHRDPEDKKCDCGAKERQGCLFPVSDDYYCKFYEKGGAV